MKTTITRSIRQYLIFLTLLFILAPVSVNAQQNKQEFIKEMATINTLIDDYNLAEDNCDFETQAKLMSKDRIFVGAAGEGRAVDQKRNMEFQKVHLGIVKEEVPGIIWYTDARDRIIRFYGNGSTAVASFFWLRAVYLPAHTPPEVAERYPNPDPHAVTLVLEKKDGNWKIVHTHMSLLYPVLKAN